MTKKLCSNKWLWFGVIVVGFILVYGLSVSRESMGYLGSDYEVAMGFVNGLLPSPGYPVYGSIIFLVGKLAEFGDWGVSYVFNWLSAVMGSLAMGFMFLSLFELYGYGKVAKKQKREFVLINHELERWFLAGVSTVGIGTAGLYWQYSSGINRHVFSGLVTSIFVWSAVRGLLKSKKQVWFIRLSFLMLGVGASHNWVFLIYTVFWAYWLWKEKVIKTEAQFLKMGLVFLIFWLAPFGLFFTKDPNAFYALEYDQSLAGLTRHVGTAYLGDGVGRTNDIRKVFAGFQLSQSIRLGYVVMKYFWLSAGWWLAVPVIGLVIQLSKKKKSKFLELFLWLFGLGLVGLLFLVRYSSAYLDQVTSVPQFLQLWLMFGCLLWFGFWEMLKRLGATFEVITSKINVWMGIIVSVSLLIIAGVFSSYGGMKYLDNLATENVYQGMLEDTQKDSLLFCFRPMSCGGLIYNQLVLGHRKDVVVIPFYYEGDNINLPTSQELSGFSYDDFPWIIFDLITWNIDQKSVYVVDLFDQYYKLLGVDSGFVKYLPIGNIAKLSYSLPNEEKIPDTDHAWEDVVLGSDIPIWNLETNSIKGEEVRRNFRNAYVYMRMGMRKRSYEESNYASNLLHTLGPAEKEEGLASREWIERVSPSVFYEPGSSADSAETILGELDTFDTDEFKNRAVLFARGAVTVDPKNVDARLVWAEALEKLGYEAASGSAAIEYHNVLKLDADNQMAKDRLKAINE